MIGDIIRPAVFAERGWYPSDPEILNALLDQLLIPAKNPVKAKAVIVPHAGYRFSGPVAGKVFSQIQVPPVAVLLGPAHSWEGSRFAIMTEGIWEIPVGKVPIHAEFAALLQENLPILHHDADAHHAEHALELQLPFLLRRRADISFVPVRMGDMTYEKCVDFSLQLAESIRALDQEVLVVASSDMHHHEQTDLSLGDQVVQAKDALALEMIETLDPEGLYRVVREEEINMCGLVPAVIALLTARHLEASSVRTVAHATSADVSGDYSYVVGYAGCVVE